MNSRFLSSKMANMSAYTPGEQPQDKSYIKLNTNECPYPPSPKVTAAIKRFSSDSLRLYPDPTSASVKQALSKAFKLPHECFFVGGGSDEALAYSYMAFFSAGDTIYYPNVTYGFYKVYSQLFSLCPTEIPLNEDFSIDPVDYHNLSGNAIIANPNAPTGIALSTDAIEEILKRNPNRLIIVDEAYIDFAENQSMLPFVKDYDNLLVVQTFSKSRSLAGMRLGFAAGNPKLINGLEKVKFSFNPYNIDRLSEQVAVACLEDSAFFHETCAKIKATRQLVYNNLISLGFLVTPSEANFLFVSHKGLSGEDLYKKLKEQGVLVRHFPSPLIKDYIRVTVGTDEEMDAFIVSLKVILGKENLYEN